MSNHLGDHGGDEHSDHDEEPLDAPKEKGPAFEGADKDGSGYSPGKDGQAIRLLRAALDKAISVPDPMIEAYVTKLRGWAGKKDQMATPSAAIKLAEKQYLASVTSMGAATGATAAAPGVGVGLAIAASGGELAANLSATMLHILTVARIHGLDVSDIEKRRTLIYVAFVGQSAPAGIQKLLERAGPYWAKNILKAIPREAINAANKVLGPRFITLYGTKQGVIVLGRVIPFGIGAVVGGTANAAVGLGVVKGVRKAFPPAPADWAWL